MSMKDSFSYISFGNWDHVQGDIDSISMIRGRMFEYTPTDLEKRLENLGAEATAFLEKLPTFLCSEIESSRTDNWRMLVKFGRINGTTVTQSKVASRFETLVDFGEVEFEDHDAAKEVFGADEFQLYRTHWAVRAGSAIEILRKLQELKPEVSGAIDSIPGEFQLALEVEPPARKKNIIGEADSVETFLEALYKHPSDGPTESFFRGHGDEKYELIPSLLRRWKDGSWKHLPDEDRLCKELLIAHYDEFQGDQYSFDRLVRMQHYGLPTRLLDISGNPLVALFFACNAKEETPSVDGEVIVFRVPLEKIKYYDSDTVSCLSNLSNLTFEQKGDVDLSLETPEFNATKVGKKLLHHIMSEKGFFEGRIIPQDLGSLVCVKAKQTNSRIRSQSGAFLLFGHDATLPDSGGNGIEISRITVRNKEHILSQLDSININATTVYPSIDQTAVHLRDRYLRKVDSTDVEQ
ncbi:FRG domain-containing protein [Falsihalocynthiibacter sp. BN13B15]|uniref:FRG domain-containing protein n=1 Tax=Falsihalocynthiibacter sp. BN13B15 TaxID=3240871 RepID=UPI003510B306